MPTVVLSFIEIRSQMALQMHIWTAKNWMQFSASPIATALLHLKTGLRSNLRASLSWRSMPQDTLVLCTCSDTYTSDAHATPPLSENPGYGPEMSCALTQI